MGIPAGTLCKRPKQAEHTLPLESMKPTAACWYKVTSQLNLDTSKFHLIPLMYNPNFSPGMSSNTREKLIVANLTHLKSLFKKSSGTLRSYGEITGTEEASRISHYLYMQLRHYALSKYPKACLPLNHPLIEQCKQSSTQQGLITGWYKTINETDPTQTPHKYMVY